MANRKHQLLANEAWLKEQLIDKQKSVMQVAKEASELIEQQTGIKVSPQNLHGCITYRKNRWPKEDQLKIFRQRQPNKPKQLDI